MTEQWAAVCIHDSREDAMNAHDGEQVVPWPADDMVQAELRFWRAVARRRGECLVAIEEAVSPEGVRLGYEAMSALLTVRQLLGKEDPK